MGLEYRIRKCQSISIIRNNALKQRLDFYVWFQSYEIELNFRIVDGKKRIEDKCIEPYHNEV